MRNPDIRTLALVLALALSTAAQAEKGDRDKPVNIESDALRVDDVKKTAVYEGNVVLTQGTMLLSADRLEVRQDAEGFKAGEATGNRKPVYFRQKRDGLDEYVEGSADRLEYDARAEFVKLLGNAQLKRGEERLRGNVITYDVRSETYRAQGSSPEAGTGRVRAVILPKKAGQPAEAKP